MRNWIHVWSNISLNSLRFLRATWRLIEYTFPILSRGDGLWCFWVPAWRSLWRRQCGILSVDSCSHLKNGYSPQHTAGFLWKKYLIENNDFEKQMFICFACTCIILNLYGKLFEDWFTAKSVCEDEAFVNLAQNFSHANKKLVYNIW